jgi:hypothetical protein
MKARTIVLLIIVMLVSPYALAQTTTTTIPVEDKVGVLITAWGQPNRYIFEYSWENHYWCRIGDTTEYPDQPCKIGHVGGFHYDPGSDTTISQLSHLGLMPWGLNHEWPGFEFTYDRAGYYFFDVGTGMYLSINPNHPSLDPDFIPPGTDIVPAVEVTDFMTGKLQFPADPRTGEDLLEGWYLIGSADTVLPNGLCDANELNNMIFIYYYKIMGLQTEPWTAAEVDEAHLFFEAKMAATKTMLENAFGDQIDVRDGYYTGVPGYTKHELEVTEEFATEGFRKILTSRETTDNNHYANDFLVLNYVKERLCELGVLDETEVHMTRQIGRTPEYNSMNVEHVRPYIESYSEGSRIAILYVTHGLSWPGRETFGFMGVQHPWWKEVIHENGYLNYLSWRDALKKEFGDRYDLVFNIGEGESDLLEDNFFSYGYFDPSRLNGDFYTVREIIQMAKTTGADKMIMVPGHWHGDAQDTQYIMRNHNNLPLVPMADMQAGNLELTYCEDADDNEVDCADPSAVAEITITPSYNDLTTEFATVYYVRLRGGIERFDVYPTAETFDTKVTQPITKASGGTVAVTNPASDIDGAQIIIPSDPYPTSPEDFTPETAIPFNDPADPFECMWEDADITVAHRTNPPPMTGIIPVGPAVHVGPYRFLFNCDVTVTIPYDTSAAGTLPVRVYVYNHLTEGWESIDHESIDVVNGFITFKTQTLGLFQAAAGDEDGDAVVDTEDNCVGYYNPGQEDTYPPDGNGIGNRCECEGNFDCDQDCDGSDAATFKIDFGRNEFFEKCTAGEPCNGDFDCDGDCDGTDAARFKQDFGRSEFSDSCPECEPSVPWCGYL